MSELDSEALTALTSVLQSQLPSTNTLVANLSLALQTTKITPTGIGGYVSPNADPLGDVVGRLVNAMAVIQLQADDVNDLDTAVTAVIETVGNASRASLRSQGILRLQFNQLSPRATVPGQGNQSTTTQAIHFQVLYEFLKQPEIAEGGVIEEIPLNLSVQSESS